MSEFFVPKMMIERTKALQCVLHAKPSLTTDIALFDFLSTYILCEALASKIIEYWATDLPPKSVRPGKLVACSECGAEIERAVSRNKSSGNGFKTLDVGNLKKALIHFEINLPAESTDSIYKSGKGIVKQRTARQLRNGYAHSLSSSAKEEINERSRELLDVMEKFCTAVKAQISQSDT